jgi:hypothetical protein
LEEEEEESGGRLSSERLGMMLVLIGRLVRELIAVIVSAAVQCDMFGRRDAPDRDGQQQEGAEMKEELLEGDA